MTEHIWTPIGSYDAYNGDWKDAVTLLLRQGVEAFGSRVYSDQPMTIFVNPKDKDMARRILAIAGPGARERRDGGWKLRRKEDVT